jgi:hypothetical protein
MLTLLLWSARAVAQGEGVEEAVAVLESEQFLSSLSGCFPASDRPAEVTLTTRVSGEGVASLTQITPMLLAGTSTCLAQVVAALQFPQSAWGVEITFAVPVADLPAPAPAQPPPPGPATTPPTAAVYYVAPQPGPQADWKKLHDSGTRKTRAGAALLGVGGALLLSGTVMAVIMSQTQNEGIVVAMTAPMALSLVGGLGLLVPGAIVLGIGRRRLRQAEQMRLSACVAPLRGGAALLLAWTF